MLYKTKNCSAAHCFPLLMPFLTYWPGDFRNYHVLRALILACKIYFFQVIVIVFSNFMIIFAIILTKERYMKWRYRRKSSFFIILWNIFIANLELLLTKKILVPVPNTMIRVLCDDIARKDFWIWKTSVFQIQQFEIYLLQKAGLPMHWFWLVCW